MPPIRRRTSTTARPRPRTTTTPPPPTPFTTGPPAFVIRNRVRPTTTTEDPMANMIVMNDRALQDVPLPFGREWVENQLSQGQTKEEIEEILDEFRTPAEWPW